jgi:hypothetical protein
VGGLATLAPPGGGATVVDLFAGSGNTLYWLLRHQPGARGLGFELDDTVYALTRANLALLDLPIALEHVEYRAGLAALAPPADHLLVAFIAPPWGEALDPLAGLDLRRTTPPIAEIVDVLATRFVGRPLLCAIQVFEQVDPGSLDDVTARFDWSAFRVYRLNEPGQDHGVLLGTCGWAP